MAHYLRCLQLAHFLKPYFKIKFVYSSSYYSFINEAGFETFDCAALDARKVQQGVSSFDFSWLNEKDLNFIYKAQVRIINETKAVAVLGDMSPTLKMAAERTGVFHFSLFNGYMSRYYTYVRRMPKSYPFYNFFNLLPSSLFQYLTNVGEGIFFQTMHRAFGKIRKREKLLPKYSYMEELEGDANLLCDLPEIFPQKSLPDNYYFIPPLFHLLQESDHTAIDFLDSNKKTLYISMGSTGNWKKVAFLNNASFHRYNLVTAGDHEKILHGPHIFSYSFINSKNLFAKTDLVICHGGNGTIYQALSHGIPVLCKTSHFEQDYNVEGLERLQIGRSLDDLPNDKEYIAIIEEWILKKNSFQLTFIKDKIATANGKFTQITAALFSDTFCKKRLQKVVDN